MSASHSCAADFVSVSSTVCRSNVERLITLSTSAVAVCCCSDSRNSLSSRAFSIAMTAWAAKFVTSSICLSVNGAPPGGKWRPHRSPCRSGSSAQERGYDTGELDALATQIVLGFRPRSRPEPRARFSSCGRSCSLRPHGSQARGEAIRDTEVALHVWRDAEHVVIVEHSFRTWRRTVGRRLPGSFRIRPPSCPANWKLCQALQRWRSAAPAPRSVGV